MRASRHQRALVVIAVLKQRAVGVEIIFVHRSSDSWPSAGDGSRHGIQRQRRTQSRIEVTNPERLPECRKGRFTGAVSGAT